MPIFLLGLLLIGAQLGINFYITALPLIAFEVGASEVQLVRTMYYYLIPYGIIGIFLAPFAYKIGFKSWHCWA
jgi:hypothetical protein